MGGPHRVIWVVGAAAVVAAVVVTLMVVFPFCSSSRNKKGAEIDAHIPAWTGLIKAPFVRAASAALLASWLTVGDTGG